MDFPSVLLESLRKRFPSYGRGDAASSIEALRRALVRLTEGELDGKPLSAEAAVAYVRQKIELARVEYATREKKYIPHFQSWLNKRAYLSSASEQPYPASMEDAISILELYPTVMAVDVKTHLPVLRIIDAHIDFYRATHGASAVSFIRQRVARYRECVSRWPESELTFVPSPDKFFRERRYEQDDKFWIRTPRGFEAERGQILRVLQ